MALTRRAVAAAMAGVALAGAAAFPAQAYWTATGHGTGTAPTATASPRVVTLSLTTAAGKKVVASGSAGSTAAYGTSVKVVLCAVATWPCPSASLVATLTPTVSGGSYSVTTGNLNGFTVYGLASQTQISGWPDYSAVAGPVTP